MGRFRAPAIAALASALCFASSGGAQTTLIANLNNFNEPTVINPTMSNGAPRPASFGTAMFVLNAAQTQMTFTATIFNIDFGGQTADVNDNLTAAHIHAGPGATTTFPVVWGFFGSPLNDNNPNDVVNTPFSNGAVGGTISGKWDLAEGNGAGVNLTSQLPNILSEHAYINFHTTQFGGGEVRGTLVVVTPEPSTVLLMATGLFAVGLAGRARSRRRSA